MRKRESLCNGSRGIRVGLGLSRALGLIAGQDSVRNPFMNGVRLVNCGCVGDRGSADDGRRSSVLASNRLGDRNVLVLGADEC
jgi:hypothetical protein